MRIHVHVRKYACGIASATYSAAATTFSTFCINITSHCRRHRHIIILVIIIIVVLLVAVIITPITTTTTTIIIIIIQNFDQDSAHLKVTEGQSAFATTPTSFIFWVVYIA